MSLTCDESSTLHVTEAINALDIWYKANWFTSANNHILNSALLRISVSVFGWHEWAIRLPNILAYALYLFASYKISTHISANKILGLLGIIVISASPFLLDFFSIARGYGIASAFALFATSIYITSNSKYKIWFACGLLVLAILANFTYLNYFVAFIACINLNALFIAKSSFKDLVVLNIVPLVSTIIIGAILLYAY